MGLISARFFQAPLIISVTKLSEKNEKIGAWDGIKMNSLLQIDL